jgi:DNA-directed RNA polymerase specialized sigma24 family protein
VSSAPFTTTRPSTLRTWIYRIAVNQARNRHQFWRRRHRNDQVSLDAHIAHGDFPSTLGLRPDRVFEQKNWAYGCSIDRLPFDQRTAIVLREIDGRLRGHRVFPGCGDRNGQIAVGAGQSGAARRSAV